MTPVSSDPQYGSLRRTALLAAALALALGGSGRADEGMWTFNNFPKQAVRQQYGFDVDEVARPRAALVGAARRRLLGHVRLARRPGDDQPPLRPRLHRAAVDRGARTSSQSGFYAKTAARRGEAARTIEAQPARRASATSPTGCSARRPRALAGSESNERRRRPR